MIKKTLHFFVAHVPITYDILRWVLGFSKMQKWLAPFLADLKGQHVIDLGAGNGDIVLPILPAVSSYCWLDPDPLKLALFQERVHDVTYAVKAIIGDAAHLPFIDDSFDTTLFFSIAHHLDDHQFINALAESARVTKDKMVFLNHS